MIGSAISDAASGSSNSQQDGQRNSHRPTPIGGPLVRNSTHETRTEASAIDPLSQVSVPLMFGLVNVGYEGVFAAEITIS